MYITLNRFDKTKKTKKVILWKYIQNYNNRHKLSYLQSFTGLQTFIEIRLYCCKCDFYHGDGFILHKTHDDYIKDNINKIKDRLKNGGLC